MVAYTTPVLTADLTVIGPISVLLYLRSTLDDTDVFVRLCDVSPKGRSINVSDGIIRLSPANVTKDADWVFATTIAMWPTANTFKAGHRIRLQVFRRCPPLRPQRRKWRGAGHGHGRLCRGRPGDVARRRAPVHLRAAQSSPQEVRVVRWSAGVTRPTLSPSPTRTRCGRLVTSMSRRPGSPIDRPS